MCLFGTEWVWYQVGQKLHLCHICPPEINWCLHQLEWMCVVMWSDMVVYAFNHDTWEAKAEGLSLVSDQPGLPNEFLANHDFIARPYIRTNKQEKIMGSECVMSPYTRFISCSNINHIVHICLLGNDKLMYSISFCFESSWLWFCV